MSRLFAGSKISMQRAQSVSSLTLVAMMGAVGNVLGVLAIYIGQIPTGGASQVALDFSSLAVVIVALFAGWRLGALTGLIAGIGPMIMFGYVQGSTGFITILLPVGKAMTGLFVGLIGQYLGPEKKLRPVFALATIWLGFIPEAILTWFYFVNLVPFFVPQSFFVGPVAATVVLVKAWAEMVIIGFLTVALLGNAGFRSFLGRVVGSQALPTS